jgi:hypothetical protein
MESATSRFGRLLASYAWQFRAFFRKQAKFLELWRCSLCSQNPIKVFGLSGLVDLRFSDQFFNKNFVWHRYLLVNRLARAPWLSCPLPALVLFRVRAAKLPVFSLMRASLPYNFPECSHLHFHPKPSLSTKDHDPGSSLT